MNDTEHERVTGRETLEESATFDITVADGHVFVEIVGDGPVVMTPTTTDGLAMLLATKAQDAKDGR